METVQEVRVFRIFVRVQKPGSNALRKAFLRVCSCFEYIGESVYGYRFNDENLKKLFTHRGQVAMANSGQDSNGEASFRC
jgi:cyclophilin family peptidyl-prolyl cis-trans isomerase